MNRIIFCLMLLSIVVVMACGTKLNNDGYAISERLLKSSKVDAVDVERYVGSMDTLLAPEIFGRDFGKAVVEILENDTIVDAKELNRRVKMLRTELTEQRGGWYNKRFVEGVQSYVDALNLERRMKLYTIVSSPEQMGTALRIDKIHAGADTARIVEQKRVLRSLSTIEEWNRFEENYNRK